MLMDRYGRVATDLRVSLTDRCNLRCQYCMPEEGLDWLAKSTMLTDDEVVRLIRVGVEQLGITEVRFTGGEPLIRRGLVDIITQCAQLSPRPQLSITTNALGLPRTAPALAEAGLDRVNISFDTLDPERFYQITRRRRHADVLAGIDAAAQAGLTPVKGNAVLLRGINDDEAPALLAWALEHGIQLRFIEQMPLDPQHGWDRQSMVTGEEILTSLRAHYDLVPETPEERGSAPAERFMIDGGPEVVGVIASVTKPFCGTCDRTRLTADGQIRTCLFATQESDLRDAMRSGATDEQIAASWTRAMAGKAAGHGIDDPGFLQPDRPMSAIGG